MIPAWGFFLIAHEDYNSNPPVVADLTYNSAGLGADNAVLLYSAGGTPGRILYDLVGWGAAPVAEGPAFPQNPTGLCSLERKAFFHSTVDSMADADQLFGNSYDANNNSLDFVYRVDPDCSEPQNRTGTPEPCCTTLSGTLTLQGRTDHSGIEVLMWPGSNLRTTTDSSGHFSIPIVPAIADAQTPAYTVQVSFPGYLTPRTTLDLRDHLDERTISLPPWVSRRLCYGRATPTQTTR